MGDQARLAIDARRTAEGVRLDPLLTVELSGVPAAVDVRTARPIGAHGVSVVDPADARRIVIAPTVAPLGADELTLLRGRGPLVAGVAVPADAVEEFTAGYVAGSTS